MAGSKLQYNGYAPMTLLYRLYICTKLVVPGQKGLTTSMTRIRNRIRNQPLRYILTVKGVLNILMTK